MGHETEWGEDRSPLQTPVARAQRATWRERVMKVLVFLGVLALGLVVLSNALAQDLDRPMFLVATEKLDGTPFARAVFLASPHGKGHVGVALNKPSASRMIDLFPEHEPARAVEGPVYLGGPMGQNVVLALARFETMPSPMSVEMLPGLFLVIDTPTVDMLIATRPNEARYFAGFVRWMPGALAERIEAGYFVMKPADPERVFSDPATLYEWLMPAGGKGTTT